MSPFPIFRKLGLGFIAKDLPVSYHEQTPDNGYLTMETQLLINLSVIVSSGKGIPPPVVPQSD